MSEKYPDLYEATFPESVALIPQKREPKVDELPIIQQYYNYINNGNITGANNILESNPSLKETIFDAKSYNKLSQETIAVQRYFKEVAKGDAGEMPKHEWVGTSLKFENPDGSWGTPVDLKSEYGAGDMKKEVYDKDNDGIVDMAKDVSTKNQPNGIASLDSAGNVPTEQLGNVAYLKDFYGRSVKKFDVTDPHQLSDAGVSFNLMDFTKNHGIVHKYANPYSGDSGSDLYVTYVPSGTNGLRISSVSNRYEIDIYAGTGGENQINSLKKYNVTNLNSLTIQTGTVRSNFRIGFSSDVIRGNTNNFILSKYITTTNSNSTIILDTSSISGDYYLQIAMGVTSSNDTPSEIRALEFNYNSNAQTIVNIDYSKKIDIEPKKISLKPASLTGYFIPPMQIESGFIDWYNLNALVDTPPNTSVRFDIYDNNDNLLKADVKQGEILKLANPIIKPKITLTRDVTTTPSPTFSWLEIGMRGIPEIKSIEWKDLGEINITSKTAQIDIAVPDGIQEIRIVGIDLFVSDTHRQPYIRFNNITSGYSYNYSVSYDTGKNSTTSDGIYMADASIIPQDGVIGTNCEILITNYTNSKLKNINYSFQRGGSYYASIGTGSLPMNDKITLINFIMSYYYFTSGKLKIWGR